jgi:hypothetical protein
MIKKILKVLGLKARQIIFFMEIKLKSLILPYEINKKCYSKRYKDQIKKEVYFINKYFPNNPLVIDIGCGDGRAGERILRILLRFSSQKSHVFKHGRTSV